MKLIIYGLGKGLEYIERNIKKGHQIIGYSDSFAIIDKFHGKPFYKPNELSKVCFDFLIIAVRDRKEAWKLFELLTSSKYCLITKKVIPFYVYAKGEYWNICMTNADIENVSGLILGTSYARYGILPEYLSVSFINLSVPSQDLYGSAETFKECICQYGNRLHKLKYVIIDLYDYNYFNFDASLCRMFMRYLGQGGILREHNFARNSHYNGSLEKEVFEYNGVLWKLDTDVLSIMDELFREYQALDFEDTQYNRWRCIEQFAPLPVRLFNASIVAKKFENTIRENIQIFSSFLDAIQSFNPDIKIFLILLPRYVSLEELKNTTDGLWKEEFSEIIMQECQRENVYFLNYKNCKEISENRRFYYDIEHLNTIGGRCMTSIIEEDINRYI